jgi:hypothetical protein
MVKLFALGRRSRFSPAIPLACLATFLSWTSLSPRSSLAQEAARKAQQPPAADATKKDAGATGKAADASKKDAADDEAPQEIPPDPSKTQKSASVEIFKDPIAEEILDLKKFRPIAKRPPMDGDVNAVKAMAADANTAIDPNRIRRTIEGMVGELTDPKNIQALIDPPPGMPPTSRAARAIQDATTTLLEPIFAARAAKNYRFLAEYNKNLLAVLPPVLRHHLVPRIQAMIVLGQSGNTEALKLFLDEIKNAKQTVWVKLWALRGVTNIKEHGLTRLTATQDIDAARTIADQLDKSREWPWPVQYRALEALAHLRQGFDPRSPRTADMAQVAMKFLADNQLRPVVRAEAARALGMMQISSAVSKYNFGLVAYGAAQLAATLGEQVGACYGDDGKPINSSKAEYLTGLLAGPLMQAYNGQANARESGLLHGYNGNSAKDIQKVADQVQPVVRAALDLIRSPNGQLKDRKQDLKTRVVALQDYLAKNVPADRHLVPGDEGFFGNQGGAEAEADAKAPAAEPAAAKVAGARGGK